MENDQPDRQDEISHDPRSWLRLGKASPPAPSDAPCTGSYNPRDWLAPSDAPKPTEQVKPAPLDRRLLIGGGVLLGAGLAAGVGLGFGAFGPSRRLATKANVPISSQRRIFELDDLGALMGALRASGVVESDLATVGPSAVAAMKRPSGRVRAEMELRRGPPRSAWLVSLRIERDDGSGVVLTRQGEGWSSQVLTAAARIEARAVRGEVDENSFYTSAVSAGVDDRLIPEIVTALAFDFDFVREITPGDVFETVFEVPVNRLGQAVGAERLLYIAMTTRAKASAYYRWRGQGDPEARWFDADGRSVVRSLMRTPVDGARVTSNFGMRMHPVLGFMREHKGVDFGAPVGTPVYASGDGKIGFVGLHGGHGNYIRIDHTPTLSTAYAHLSAFDPASRVGAMVRQGQQIALSGNTGLSSGPHLHYEVIVNGDQVNPLTFQTESGKPLSGAALKSFLQERLRIDRLRPA